MSIRVSVNNLIEGKTYDYTGRTMFGVEKGSGVFRGRTDDGNLLFSVRKLDLTSGGFVIVDEPVPSTYDFYSDELHPYSYHQLGSYLASQGGRRRYKKSKSTRQSRKKSRRRSRR